LDDKRRVLHFALDGVILELKLKPWKIEVQLCESILASRRNALNMQDLRLALESLLDSRKNNPGDGITTYNSGTGRQAISKSSGALPTLQDRPALNKTGLSQSALLPGPKTDITFGEVCVDADPCTTCGAFVSQVLQKFHGTKVYEVEDFGFFLPNIKERLLGNGKQDAGMWLEPTEKLLTYGHYVTKVLFQIVCAVCCR